MTNFRQNLTIDILHITEPNHQANYLRNAIATDIECQGLAVTRSDSLSNTSNKLLLKLLKLQTVSKKISQNGPLHILFGSSHLDCFILQYHYSEQLQLFYWAVWVKFQLIVQSYILQKQPKLPGNTWACKHFRQRLHDYMLAYLDFSCRILDNLRLYRLR